MSDPGTKAVSRDPVAAHVVGLAGSLRAGSATQMAVRWALLGAREKGAQTRLLDLASYDLPFLGRDQEPSGRSAVDRFLGDIRAADGIVLGSPELHGSLSGVLKNALDLAERDTFEGKMLGLIGVAGGRLGASETLSHLRAIARSLHAWVVPTQVSIGAADQAFDARGEPVDPDVRDRLMSVGRQVAHFASLHKCENHLQFVKEWEVAATSDETSADPDQRATASRAAMKQWGCVDASGRDRGDLHLLTCHFLRVQSPLPWDRSILDFDCTSGENHAQHHGHDQRDQTELLDHL